jgi:hypothetical protein
VLLAVAGGGVARSADGAGPTAAAAARSCGAFTSTYRYRVNASGGVRCSLALRIVKSFIRDHERWRKVSIDGTVAGTYYTNRRRFEGWRCFEGSGGGACTKGRRTAGYQSAVVSETTNRPG